VRGTERRGGKKEGRRGRDGRRETAKEIILSERKDRRKKETGRRRASEVGDEDFKNRRDGMLMETGIFSQKKQNMKFKINRKFIYSKSKDRKSLQ